MLLIGAPILKLQFSVLSPATTRAHIARAALESIAYQIKDVLELMADDAGTELKMIRGDGGAVRNKFLMQFIADMSGIIARASELPELSALGSCVSLARLASGIYSTLEELGKIPTSFTDYVPQMDKATSDKLYAGWQAAVEQILVINIFYATS